MLRACVNRWHEARDSWRSVDSRRLLPRCLVGGASFWISKEELASSVKALCDYVLIGDCDKVVPLDIF